MSYPSCFQAIRILLWGENGLTALRAGGPPRNGNRWEVTSLTPGLLAWVGVVVSFCVSEESRLMCFCQVVFLLSADKEFRYSGKGEMTKIQYSYMFTSYKKILVKNWNTEYTRDIVKKLNNYVFSRGSRTTNSMSDEEDFTAAMDRALAGVTEGEVRTAQPEPLTEDIMDETVADAEANRERPRPSSPLTSEPNDEDEVSNIVTAPAAARGRRGGRAARRVVSNTSTRTTRNARTTT